MSINTFFLVLEIINGILVYRTLCQLVNNVIHIPISA